MIRCRVEACEGSTTGRSTLCHDHIYIGRKQLGAYLGREDAFVPRVYRGEGLVSLYAVRLHDFVKFGQAVDVRARLCGMQSGCPYPLNLYGSISATKNTELLIHERIRPLLARGEWFHWRGLAIDIAEAIRNKSSSALDAILTVEKS